MDTQKEKRGWGGDESEGTCRETAVQYVQTDRQRPEGEKKG